MRARPVLGGQNKVLSALQTCVASTAVIESAPSVRPHEYLGFPSASEVRLSTFRHARRESEILPHSEEHSKARTQRGFPAHAVAHPQAERLILDAISQPLHAAHGEALCHDVLIDLAGVASANRL